MAQENLVELICRKAGIAVPNEPTVLNFRYDYTHKRKKRQIAVSIKVWPETGKMSYPPMDTDTGEEGFHIWLLPSGEVESLAFGMPVKGGTMEAYLFGLQFFDEDPRLQLFMAYLNGVEDVAFTLRDQAPALA